MDERPRDRIEHDLAINHEHLTPHDVKSQLGGVGAKPSWCFAFDRSHRLKRCLGARARLKQPRNHLESAVCVQVIDPGASQLFRRDVSLLSPVPDLARSEAVTLGQDVFRHRTTN